MIWPSISSNSHLTKSPNHPSTLPQHVHSVPATVFLKQVKLVSISGPLHLLFSLLGMLFPHKFTWLAPSSLSGSNLNVAFSETFPHHCIKNSLFVSQVSLPLPSNSSYPALLIYIKFFLLIYCTSSPLE